MRARGHTLVDLENAPMRRGRPLGRGGTASTRVVTVHRRHGIVESYCLKEFDAKGSDTLLRELTVLSELKHPGICALHNFVPAGTLVDNEPLPHPALLVELIDGTNLRELLEEQSARRLSPHIVTEIALALMDACDYAHASIVHRDISPDNVMISCAGAVKLLDFGVARVLQRRGEPLTKTICGKPAYMSPEQAQGDVVVDQRSDLFSIGVVLYELLCGERPFDGHTVSETMFRAERGIRMPLLERVPNTPAELVAVVDRLLQPDREARFANARACFEALDCIAPPRSTRYELARLATKARNNTRITEEHDLRAAAAHDSPTLREVAHSTEISRSRITQSQQLVTSTAELTSSTIEQNAPEPTTQLAHSSAIATLEQPEHAQSPTAPTAHARSRQRRYSRAAFALVAIVSAATALVGLGATTSDAHPANNSTPHAPAPTAPTEENTTPVTVAPPAEPAAPAPAQHVVPTPAPPAPAEQQPSAPPEASKAPATLTIGTLPDPGQIWVDKRSVGWPPVTVKLPPGTHTVAAGDSEPVVTRQIELRSGERRRLVLQLPAAR